MCSELDLNKVLHWLRIYWLLSPNPHVFLLCECRARTLKYFSFAGWMKFRFVGRGCCDSVEPFQEKKLLPGCGMILLERLRQCSMSSVSLLSSVQSQKCWQLLQHVAAIVHVVSLAPPLWTQTASPVLSSYRMCPSAMPTI